MINMATNYNYNQITQKLFQGLPQRTKEVIVRRFGLKGGDRETLESIGESFGITRERVRQLEEDGISRMRPRLSSFDKIADSFSDRLKATGGLRKEDVLLEEVGGKKYSNYAFFLLTLFEPFTRYSENKDFYSLWAYGPDAFLKAQNSINAVKRELEKTSQPMTMDDLKAHSGAASLASLAAYIEVSKIIQKGTNGLYGLREWPEINPKSVKDKAYIVFKNEKKPLHFKEVAKLIEVRFSENKVFFPTVHNELIKDPRFVLVGRGTYALKEWGYEPGVVKEVIVKVLRDSKLPMEREEIVEKVLDQRFVKANTVILNLKDKKFFAKTQEGKYTLREA